jgi:hypothetical protein
MRTVDLAPDKSVRMGTEPRAASGLIASGSGVPALLSLLRSFLLATAMVVAYFVLPLGSALAADTIVVLVLGIGLVAVLLALQVRSILRSPYPAAKAVGALMVSVPLFLVLFATTYYLLAQAEPTMFSERLSRLDALYFTVTVFATVGFGDITATTQSARALTTVQMVADVVLVGLIARVVVGAVQWGRRRQRRAPEGAAPEEP